MITRSRSWLLVEMADHLGEEIKIGDEVLGRALRGSAGGHAMMEVLQLVGVGILQMRAADGPGDRIAAGLLNLQSGRQMPDVRGVVLDPEAGGRAERLQVGVEAKLLIDAGLEGDDIVAVVQQ